MKKLAITFIVAGLAGAGWYYSTHRAADAPQYQTAPVLRGDLTQAVTATGALNAVVNVQVGSQISGNIEKLFVDFNSPVKAGEVVAQLDAATYKAIVHESEGELSNAQAALTLAQINAQRQEELAKNKISPQSDYDTAKAALNQAEAMLVMKQAELEKAKVDLDRCTIYAPIDGVVISRSVDVGQTVAASLQAPVIFTIANDLRKMQIDANVAEADIGNIEVDQTVDFIVDAFAYRTFHGKVAQIRNAPITVQNVVTYDTVISVTNDELKLKPGMTANISVIIATRQDVVKLPNAALRFHLPEPEKSGATPSTPGSGGGRPRGPGRGPAHVSSAPPERTIYTLVDGTPQSVQVKLGISDGIYTEVLEGLKESDTVIIGMILPQSSASSQRPANPFGGPRRF